MYGMLTIQYVINYSHVCFYLAATQRVKCHKRHKWTHEEEMELKVLFRKAFTDGSCPRSKDLRYAVKKSLENGGQIHLQPPDNIKKKVHTMTHKSVLNTY